MAHPAPPTPATGAIPLPTPILTYLQKYQGQGDVLAGRYHKFLAPYTPDSGRTHAQLEARILSMTAEVPKVFLGLVGHAGVTSSITLHRPTRYASHPVDTSVCDRIPSTTPGAEPPRNAKDSGSARSHSTHLETSSSNRP